jgi:hypothetical protein
MEIGDNSILNSSFFDYVELSCKTVTLLRIHSALVLIRCYVVYSLANCHTCFGASGLYADICVTCEVLLSVRFDNSFFGTR